MVQLSGGCYGLWQLCLCVTFRSKWFEAMWRGDICSRKRVVIMKWVEMSRSRCDVVAGRPLHPCVIMSFAPLCCFLMRHCHTSQKGQKTGAYKIMVNVGSWRWEYEKSTLLWLGIRELAVGTHNICFQIFGIFSSEHTSVWHLLRKNNECTQNSKCFSMFFFATLILSWWIYF